MRQRERQLRQSAGRAEADKIAKQSNARAQQNALLDDIYEFLKLSAGEEYDGRRFYLNREARLVVRMRDLFGMEEG